jgi:hypothetical protein
MARMRFVLEIEDRAIGSLTRRTWIVPTYSSARNIWGMFSGLPSAPMFLCGMGVRLEPSVPPRTKRI